MAEVSYFIMVTLRPLVKPEIIKKRTKKFIWYQSDPYLKIKCNYGNPEALAIE